MNSSSKNRELSPVDRWVAAADGLLKTLAGAHTSGQPRPKATEDSLALSDDDRRRSGALMRVNHVGEVCAQALYTAQSLTARDPALRQAFEAAARDEIDHLAWTRQRLTELQSHASWLNPFWYAGAFGIGWVAGRVSDRVSLGFVVETERQVERHLAGHLEKLPTRDHASRAIVQQMKADEARHAHEAEKAGAAALPFPVRSAMRLAAKVMTTVAHRV